MKFWEHGPWKRCKKHVFHTNSGVLSGLISPPASLEGLQTQHSLGLIQQHMSRVRKQIILCIHCFLIFGASLVAQTVKRLPAMRETRLDSWVGKIPWRRKWQSTPALLPGKSHGQRSLIGYSPWGHKESDRTERLHFHFLILIDLKDNWLIKARIVITYWII